MSAGTARTRGELVGTVVFVASTLMAAIVVAVRLLAPLSPIDTDIMALVPQDERDAVRAAAIQRSASLVGSRVGFLLRHEDPTVRAAAADDLQTSLEETGLFVPAEREAAALSRWLFDHRDQLLCPADRILLERRQGAVLAEEALARIHAPLVPVRGELLRADPMLLTLRLIDCFSPPVARNRDGTLIAGRLTASPYTLDVQDRIGTVLARWRQRHAGQGVELARSGALFHAAAAAGKARAEIAWVGGISILAVISLFLYLFASLRPVLLALSAMAVGTLGGLAACLVVFSHVHALALVLGAAMSGIAVDYAIHVTVAARGQDRKPANPARTIARPLRVSVLTTLAGFACLLASGIGLMQQVAVFGGAGILLSFGFSRFVLGYWLRWPARSARSAPGLTAIARKLLGWSPRTAVLVPMILVLSPLVWFGLQQVTVLDNVRSFQPSSAGLMAEEEAVAAAFGYRIDPRFLLVRASSLEALQSLETEAVERIERPLPAPAWLDPPGAQQAADHRLIERRLLKPELDPLARMLGLDPGAVYSEPPAHGSLPSPFAEMRGRVDGMHFSIVPLGLEDARRLDQAPLMRQAELVDPADVYSGLLERLRGHASWSLVIALLACGLGLLATYRRVAGLGLLVPAALSVALVPAIAGLSGQTFSLFSVMGLFVALGVSIDFAAFQAIDRGKGATEEGWRETGILAAAMTTIVPMSILGWSDTLPIRHFGSSVALGTALGLMLSPLARAKRFADETSEER